MGKVIRVEVELRNGETSDRLVKRFLKKCKHARIVEQFKEKQYYLSPSAKRRLKNKNKQAILRKLKSGGTPTYKNKFL